MIVHRRPAKSSRPAKKKNYPKEASLREFTKIAGLLVVAGRACFFLQKSRCEVKGKNNQCRCSFSEKTRCVPQGTVRIK